MDGITSDGKGHHLAISLLLLVQGCSFDAKLSKDIASGILTARNAKQKQQQYFKSG